MKSLKLKILVAILSFAFGITAFFVWDGFKALPDAVQTELIGSPRSNNIALQISTQKSEVKVGEQISLKAVISNNDKDVVMLVSLGDGSEHAWRTPLVQWSIIKNDKAAQHPSEPKASEEGRCGLMNALKSDEVFWLASGETKELQNWVYLPPFEEPGVYRVAFLYANRPSLKWRNESSLQHNQVAFWRAKHSTETTIVSNELVFTVRE
ncbi:MAG TPA: hypothetical protein VK892_12560 [Pyrinomonadaceae bacterium]|nr:hypothetical protein [Pyrinomonadaceae bacterium]